MFQSISSTKWIAFQINPANRVVKLVTLAADDFSPFSTSILILCLMNDKDRMMIISSFKVRERSNRSQSLLRFICVACSNMLQCAPVIASIHFNERFRVNKCHSMNILEYLDHR